MLIGAFCLYIEVAFCCIGERLEEMIEHFRRHLTNFFSFELRFPYDPGSSAKVDSDLCETVIHWEAEAITLDPALVSQRIQKSFTDRKSCIFNCVVFVNVKVSLY